MTIDMSQFYQVFFEEAGEHLATMESLLLNLDVGSPDLDDLNAIFRAAHSIKGGSGTFGFTDMTEVTHELESLLDMLRKSELALREDMVDAFLAAGDVLRTQLEAHQGGAEAGPAAAQEICVQLKQLTNQPAGTAVPASQAAQPAAVQIYLIEFPQDALAQPAAGIDGLLASLAEIGDVELIASADQNDGSARLKFTGADTSQFLEIFSFLGDPDKVTIQTVTEFSQPLATSAEDAGYGFFTDIEPASATEEDQSYGFFVQPEELKAQAEDAQGFGFFVEVETPPPPPAAMQAAAPPSTAPKAADKPAAASSADSSIRVSVEKVDQMINLVGELVITQAMLAQTASEVDPVIYERLMNGMAQLERNTRDLQESVLSIRMMPISFVFSRFPRVVRDLAGKLNKKVQLKTIGEGTELDKGLIEKISDPLTHLVRNSLDHGIESPEQRSAAGKDPQGTITLRAAHQGGNIMIEVMDDGGGLNRERILAKAREKGLPVADNISDHEVWQLIFAPGFSTAAVVTDVSGRGVGMDVVKRNIEGLGGRVEIASQYGFGTTITIRLPLTLAILDGMSIAVGKETYIIPLTFIIESLQPATADIKSVTGKGKVINVRGEYLPLIALHEIFNVQARATEPEQGILVIIETDGQRAALLVDELLGQHQVVIKSLESNYRKVDSVSGATIMGDGKVAMILDVTGLVKLSQNR